MKTFLTLLAVVLAGSNAHAGLIDFEDGGLLGGDDAAITDAYLQSYGVSITATAGKNDNKAAPTPLTLEGASADGTDAFLIDAWNWGADTSGLGDYFLKVGTGDLPHWRDRSFNMSIQYNAEVSAASGEIWDIDGSEQYSVVGYDANGNVVASVDSPEGGFDGAAWTWSLDAIAGDTISSVEIDLIGNGRLRGFAFDNFDFTLATTNLTTATVPIPAAFPLGCLGLLGVMLHRRRQARG